MQIFLIPVKLYHSINSLKKVFQDLRNILKFEYQVSIIIIIIYFYEFITQML